MRMKNGDRVNLDFERGGNVYSISLIADGEDDRRDGVTLRDVAVRLSQAVEASFGEWTRTDPETGKGIENDDGT